MILISHRGNINGPNPARENSPYYVMEAIAMGYNVEIDVWLIEGALFLGHDEPQYKIDQKWLQDRKEKLWIHCKNIEAVVYFNSVSTHQYNYFWHQEDTLTLTSHNYIWAYPGKQPIKNSIAVMPELYNDDLSKCLGICSDFVEKNIH
jgi:hypothetical protein